METYSQMPTSDYNDTSKDDLWNYLCYSREASEKWNYLNLSSVSEKKFWEEISLIPKQFCSVLAGVQTAAKEKCPAIESVDRQVAADDGIECNESV